MQLVPLASVIVKKRQRNTFDPKAAQELEDSILRVGLLHPPVMWLEDGKWNLSVGERRFRAVSSIAKAGKTFVHSNEVVQPGFIPITPLGDYLDEIGRFEAEYDENVKREDITWQDKVQALADLHAMRTKHNPKQTITATAREVVQTSPVLHHEDSARKRISEAITIAEHLDDPTIANARNANEAMALIYKQEEEKVNAELIRRKLRSMTETQTLEIRHADLTSELKLLKEGTYDLILTDPPYGIDAGSAGFRARTVHHHNYQDTPEVARNLAECILAEGFRAAKPRANIFMFGAIEFFDWWKTQASRLGWVPFNRPLVWWKSDSEGLAPWGAQGPRITTEYIFYATKGQCGLKASPIDVFRFRRVPRAERTHAAEKPVDLLKALIEAATLPGESVLDPCCGSGSTIVACRESKRVGLGIESSETYYNTAMNNVFGGGKNAAPGQGT